MLGLGIMRDEGLGKLVNILVLVLVFCGGPVLTVESGQVQLGGHVVQNVRGICGTFVWSRGYDCVEFVVPTRDGFLLSVQRMFGRRFRNVDKEPVFLYHGVMQGGDVWVLNEPNESLAFILADSGYDVWIGSTRSSTFSYGHITYKRTDEEFWDWNWDDLVEYDLPAMLYFVRDVTLKPILYVGFSQGSMTGFAAFTNSELANIVKKVAMLSPVAYLDHVSSPVARAAAWLFLDQFLGSYENVICNQWLQIDLLLGIHEFNLSAEGGEWLSDAFCKHTKSNCYNFLLTLITGPGCCLNRSRIAYYNRYELQTTSTKNLAQLAQLVRSGGFCKFDYGWLGNLMHYSSIFPPSYDLSKIPKHLSFFLAHGANDQLGDEEDVKRAAEQLPGEVKMLLRPDYNHGDVLLGTRAHVDVYPYLLEFFYRG